MAYIFPFGFFLKTFTMASTARGRLVRKAIQALYYGFWAFQLASIGALFF